MSTTALRIQPGLYRLDHDLFLFRKPIRALRLTKSNRNGPSATVKSHVWVLCRCKMSGADFVEWGEATHWRRVPGIELGQFDTKREAIESMKGENRG